MTSPAPRRGRTLALVNAAAALLAGCLLAQAQTSPTSPAPAAGATAAKKGPAKSAAASKTPDDKSAVSYSVGVMMGTQMREAGVGAEAISTERVAQGLRDALAGKAKLSEADRKNLNDLIVNAHQAAATANHQAAAKFLAENAQKPDVVTTKSGLQYKVLAAGSGESPKASDEVSVNYRGKLLDGTEFDSSYKRGQPATFQVGRVIPGWTEALQLMKPGAKYVLYIPPQLAYDLRSPPSIPPGSMLIFDVELLGVKAAPPAAAPAPAAPAQSSKQ